MAVKQEERPQMKPQQKFDIDVILLKGSKRWGSALGNNASWYCACIREMLMGRSNEQPVVCSHCDRTYLVEGEGSLGRVIRVVEIERDRGFASKRYMDLLHEIYRAITLHMAHKDLTLEEWGDLHKKITEAIKESNGEEPNA
jgi:hypothetical protein